MIPVPTNLHGHLQIFCFLLLALPVQAQEWRCRETLAFKCIYQPRCRTVAKEIVEQAEQVLARYKKLFDYQPKEKITLIVRDIKDLSAAAATPIPFNTIKIDIAPPAPDYEFLNERHHYTWLLSHELAHIYMNDQAGAAESAFRSVFGKAMPATEEPWTLPASLLGNRNRYSPLWIQEGFAVFMETWLNGGYGRCLGNLDEMYFRAQVFDERALLAHDHLDLSQENSYLLQTLSYFYGARFMSWLVLQYGLESWLLWIKSTDWLASWSQRFEAVYGQKLASAWQGFIHCEIEHQQVNRERLGSVALTAPEPLCEPQGWVSKAYFDSLKRRVIFATNRPGELASIKSLDLRSHLIETIASCPTPNMVQVAATAFDPRFYFFYYTTQNSLGFRDIWVIDLNTREKKLLFRNCRMGNLAIAPVNHALWGIQVHNGRATLAVSPYPYRRIIPLFTLADGNTLSQLACCPDNNQIAATLRTSAGQQKIILFDARLLIEQKRFLYETIAESGSPEFPAWSSDGSSLYWNAHVSGVDNIFLMRRPYTARQPLSNVACGLFSPTPLAGDSLLGMQFTPDGFQPALLSGKPVKGLQAIRYLGQSLVAAVPALKEWEINACDKSEPGAIGKDKSYHGLAHLKRSFSVPYISGYQHKLIGGIAVELRDPLLQHRLLVRMGRSDRHDWHGYLKYAFQDEWSLEWKKDPDSFYDMLNQRRMNMPGKSAKIEMKKWWRYDLPATVEQWTYLLWGQGLNDVAEKGLQQKDLISLGMRWQGKSWRKSIGSVDHERGYEWNLLASTSKGLDASDPSFVARADIAVARSGFWPHHTFRVQTAAGIAAGKELMLGRFYFGGFGNRWLEDQASTGFRQLGNFPGLAYKSLPADRFVKFGIETLLPPIDVAKQFGFLGLHKAAVYVFSQSLFFHHQSWLCAFNAGVQTDFSVRLFYLLESTFSFGYATAWTGSKRDQEFMISLKLLRD
jgi:hypothetical protein